MKRVFSSIRNELVTSGKFRKYFLYAVGEIGLVVIGILIAIQVDNWNEARQEKAQFKADLEQIYSTLDRDIDVLNYGAYVFEKQAKFIDSLLHDEEAINPRLLPFLLVYADSRPNRFRSEINYQLEHLVFDREDAAQRALTKSISEYANTLVQNEISYNQYVIPLLEAEHISIPALSFGVSDLNGFANLDLNFYSADEIEAVRAMLKTDRLKHALKSLRSMKVGNAFNFHQLMLSARTKQESIKRFFPDVTLLYAQIGVVGDGTGDSHWENDVFLRASDPLRAVWEGDLKLVGGQVKFRNDHSWILNWGGTGFPEGQLLFNGDNIKVEPGRYHLVVDLSKKSYKFARLD